jgi:type I restriction enzyme S subunit
MVKLGEVASFVRGITFKPGDVIPVNSENAVACMRTKNVQEQIDLSDVWGIPRSFVKRPDQFVREGDLLVSTANSWNLVGKCSWVPVLPWPTTVGGFIAALRGGDRIDPRYLYHWFASSDVQARVRNCARQTTNIANLSFDRCLDLILPLLPLPEQKRIAAILDQADVLRRKRTASVTAVTALGASLFRDLFGDVRTNDADWPADIRLGDLCEIVSGITKGRKLNGQATRDVAYMTVATVQDGFLKLDKVKTIEATEAEIDRYRLRASDILLTEGGDPDKLGRGAMWNGELPECIHQNHVFRVRVRDDRLHPVFATWLLGSARGKEYFFKSAKQTTGIASINSTQLKMFPLLLPPFQLQALFAEKLEAILKQRRILEIATVDADALFTSLQHRAFRGEL